MKRKQVSDQYRLHSNRSKKAIKQQYFTAKPESVRRKSLSNEYEFSKRQKNRLSTGPDDYSHPLGQAKNKNKRRDSKNITIESSRNSSKVHGSRPMSTKRKHFIGMFKHNDRSKLRKTSRSPSALSRQTYSYKTIDRGSNSSMRRMHDKHFRSVNQSKRSNIISKPKAMLKISLTGHGTISPCHNTARARSQLSSYSNRLSGSCRNKFDFKQPQSTRKSNEFRTRNYHTTHTSHIESSMKRKKSSHVSSKRASKQFNMYNYVDSSTPNMYTNEYSSHTGTQNSQFTFGATPDSRLSNKTHSGTNSVNKSVSKETDIMYSMRDIIKQNKMRSKNRKSSVSDSKHHHRSSSKTSKKGKKHSKKKSHKQNAPSMNGYFKVPSSERLYIQVWTIFK